MSSTRKGLLIRLVVLFGSLLLPIDAAAPSVISAAASPNDNYNTEEVEASECADSLTEDASKDGHGRSQRSQVKVGRNKDNDFPNLRLILVRHGESFNNVQHEISRERYLQYREADPSLTENGFQQAQETAEYFTTSGHALLQSIDEIHVSPLRRTLQTAQPLARALNMAPLVTTDIYEVGGVYQKDSINLRGMTKTEIMQGFPNYILPEDVTEQGWYPLEQKETKKEGRQRVEQVYRRLLEQARTATDDRTIVMVVHGDFIDFLVQTALGIQGEEEQKVFPCWNTCITILDINHRGKPMLLMHNSVAHLTTVKTQSLGTC